MRVRQGMIIKTYVQINQVEGSKLYLFATPSIGRKYYGLGVIVDYGLYKYGIPDMKYFIVSRGGTSGLINFEIAYLESMNETDYLNVMLG